MAGFKYQRLNQNETQSPRIDSNSKILDNDINIPNDRFWRICVCCVFLIILMFYNTAKDHSPIAYDISINESYTLINRTDVATQTNSSEVKSVVPHRKYFVHTEHCRMLYVDPFTPGALKLFKNESYKSCSKDESLISPIFDKTQGAYFLHINTQYTSEFSEVNEDFISCCYHEILRTGSGANADKSIKLLPCTTFHQDFQVPDHVDFISTECKLNSTQKVVQKDAFSFIHYRNLTTPTNITKIRKKPGVLLIGIDSLSRFNFRRTMKKTANYLDENHWFELEGYNKVGDNTFPNLLALLTGYNETTAYAICKPKSVGGLDLCPLMWKEFKRMGYRTAYAEDIGWISTFNYLKKGFKNPPTDHYLHPMALGIEKSLKIVKRDGLPYCIGRKQYAEYIYDYALQFSSCYSGEPIFGLFWANSFTHNGFNTASTMDDKMVEYLQALEANGALESSIVMFFSDHGRRWGPLLNLPEGFLEERLPMFFLSLPKWFKNEHPNIVRELEVNKNRLTSPYDIFMTFNHILELYEPELKLPQATDCKKCQSIFREVPGNRTCSDAGIIEHWCTCIPYETQSTKNAVVEKVTNLIINKMNKYIAAKNLTSICSTMKLKSINFAQLKLEEDDHLSHNPTYRIKYQTNPKKASFQATTTYDPKTNTVDVNVESISRLNTYAPDSKCTDDKQAKKYCICKE